MDLVDSQIDKFWTSPLIRNLDAACWTWSHWNAISLLQWPSQSCNNRAGEFKRTIKIWLIVEFEHCHLLTCMFYLNYMYEQSIDLYTVYIIKASRMNMSFCRFGLNDLRLIRSWKIEYFEGKDNLRSWTNESLTEVWTDPFWFELLIDPLGVLENGL